VKGQNNGVPVQADVPHGWRVLHYLDREQPWTLLRNLDYSRPRPSHKAGGIYQNWEVVRFSRTLDEAVRRAEKG